MLITLRMRRAVALNYSLNRHTEYVRQIYNIYMKIPPFDSLVWGSLRLAPIIIIITSLIPRPSARPPVRRGERGLALVKFNINASLWWDYVLHQTRPSSRPSTITGLD